MKVMDSHASKSSRVAGILIFGLIVAAGAGVVLLAQHVQPQAEKLPAPMPGTPNFGSVAPRPDGAQLKAPAGFTVSVYAEGLTSPRYMVYAPNGDLFVSSFAGSSITVLREGKNVGTFAARGAIAAPGGAPTGGGAGRGAAPPAPGGAATGGAPAPRGAGGPGAPGGAPRGGPRGPAPATPLPVANPAAAVPCSNTTVPAGAVGINQPHGMAFHNGYLYVANTNSIVRYKYTSGDITAQGMPEKIVDLIGGGHGWRNVIFNAAGTKMYVSVGSSSNNDAGEDCRRAAILEFNPDGTGGRIFASGLRNPEGLAWQPGVNNVLWTSVNERDGYGDNLPPDYITSVKDGGFYGWPYSYTGQNYDPRYVGGMPDLVKTALVPDVLIEAHSAAVGLAFYTGTQFPQRFRGGAFVGLHGSWNSSVAHGYKVIFVPFSNGKAGPTEDFLTGFVVDPSAVSKWGRPVGVTLARDGSLLVADDSGGKIWQVQYTAPAGR